MPIPRVPGSPGPAGRRPRAASGRRGAESPAAVRPAGILGRATGRPSPACKGPDTRRGSKRKVTRPTSPSPRTGPVVLLRRLRRRRRQSPLPARTGPQPPGENAERRHRHLLLRPQEGRSEAEIEGRAARMVTSRPRQKDAPRRCIDFGRRVARKRAASGFLSRERERVGGAPTCKSRRSQARKLKGEPR